MSQSTYEALKAKIGRRSFLKMAAVATAVGATNALANDGVTRKATAEEVKKSFSWLYKS